MAKMCAGVISTRMEFTLTRRCKLEFKNTFKYIIMSCIMDSNVILYIRTYVLYDITLFFLNQSGEETERGEYNVAEKFAGLQQRAYLNGKTQYLER